MSIENINFTSNEKLASKILALNIISRGDI